MSDDDAVIVREYTSAVEAQVAQLVLQANGIPAVLLRDDAGGMLPSMHLLFPARIAVRREDAELARQLLDEDASSAAAAGSEEEFAAGHEPPDDADFLDEEDEDEEPR